MKSLVRFAFLMAFATPAAAYAQVGSTTDIIMGRVTSPEGAPLAGARVLVTSVETQITRAKTTDANGRYSILFPDGGGSYRVQVNSLGYAPQNFMLARQSDEDRLVRDVVMGRNATVLQSVQVRAAPNRQQLGQRPEAGSSERGLPPGLVNRLPIEAGDLNALATLAPGVIGVAGTDSTPASFSVGGQPANQNSLTLDGLTFGSGTVPQEAVRNTRVITSTYDVARGQFTGGVVAGTTRGGTNVFQGAVNYSLRDPSLEFVDDPENTFSQKYTQNQLSGGFGGPIIRNKAFVFGAVSYTRRTDPLQSLLATDPLALQRLGTNSDSVSRFISLLGRFGLQPTSSLIPEERLNNNGSALIRVDYTLSDAHSLMLRGDWRGSAQDASRISPFSVPHSGGNARSSGGGGMITLSSHRASLINELRLYSSVDSRNTDPYLRVPSGRVTVASNLPDGTLGVSTLQFGVNSSLPQESRSRLTELSDEVSRVARNGSHRLKLGMLLNEDRSESGSFSNALGTFHFNSLADFEAGRASSFTRTLSSRDRDSRSLNGALYLGDAWRKSQRLQFTYGLRLEGSAYPDAPGYNPAIDSLFGMRTDRFPSEIHLSPRAGFTFTYGQSRIGPALGSIRGGFGEFRGRAPSQLFASAADATGLGTGQSQIVCVGSTVPSPDWDRFMSDPSAIPAGCNGAAQQFGNQRRNVTTFGDGFAAPRAWRGSLGFSRRFAERYNFSLDASFARGVAQTSARDLNLNTNPGFNIAAEGGRPVFVPITSIVPATGAVSLTGSRLQRRFGVVSQINSDLESSTRQLTASLNGITTRALVFNGAYTYTRSRDDARGVSTSAGGFGGFGGGSGATTAGNPNIAERATSDQERRHSLVGTITWPIRPGIELTAISRVSSGSFFTPLVGGDVNGDGIRNDRPFVFDPASSPDTALSNGMTRLLATAPARARECLQGQTGTIAARNSCSVPWTSSFDLQANFRPNSFGLQRKLTVSVVAINTLTGIDQLLHGSGNLRGWGQPVFPDRTLLYVRGFDPAAQRFIYQVNEHFGAANGSRNAFRVPFQLALQARLALGTDPARQQMGAVFGGGGAGTRQSASDFRERLRRAVPNPFRQILELNDSLRLDLSADQKSKLSLLGDSLQVKADTLVGALAQTLGGSEARTADPMELGMRMRGRIQEGRTLALRAIKDAEAVLTIEQWAKVPRDVKEPFQRPREGEGRGFGPPGG